MSNVTQELLEVDIFLTYIQTLEQFSDKYDLTAGIILPC